MLGLIAHFDITSFNTGFSSAGIIFLFFYQYFSKLYFTDCDYQIGPYYATFPAFETTTKFNVNITDDHVYEEYEAFNLVIGQIIPLPGKIVKADPYRATVTIKDDEQRK